ncbi:MAG: YHS domain-containing protein [Bryobacteraceae bacterium]|nr:YHS domain-containing protein [Bryobacteraceae bacterium]
MVRDPVCGMEFEAEEAQATADYEGQTYYFCCPECREQFLKKPTLYLQRTMV